MNRWLGKVLGVFIGYSIGQFFGAIVGYFLGDVIDRRRNRIGGKAIGGLLGFMFAGPLGAIRQTNKVETS